MTRANQPEIRINPGIEHPSFQVDTGQTLWVFYQSHLLLPYSDRLIHAFTGKPTPVGDAQLTPEEVQINRANLCQALNINYASLIVPQQIHSAMIKTAVNNETFEATDAIIVDQVFRPALIQTADCTPILLYAPDRHIGAVIHAGWRGTAQAIAQKTALRLIEEYQANPGLMIAVIGPAIGGCCYEVSEEVVEAVQVTLPQHIPPVPYLQLNDKGNPQVDLRKINQLQLEAVDIGTIEIVNACTRCHHESFWSHRRGETGRQGLVLELRP